MDLIWIAVRMNATYLWWWIVEERVEGSLCIPVASFEHCTSLKVVTARDRHKLLDQRRSVAHLEALLITPLLENDM